MLFQIEPNSSKPIYRQIVEQVREAIVCGQLGAGDQLPSLRELAAELVINHLTVKQAYSLLEHEGLIHTLRGRGTFVSARATGSLRKRVEGDLAAQMTTLAASARRLGLDRAAFKRLAERSWREMEGKS